MLGKLVTLLAYKFVHLILISELGKPIYEAQYQQTTNCEGNSESLTSSHFFKYLTNNTALLNTVPDIQYIDT